MKFLSFSSAGAWAFKEGHYITEYDSHIATKLAHIIAGGVYEALVSELETDIDDEGKYERHPGKSKRPDGNAGKLALSRSCSCRRKPVVIHFCSV